MTDDPSAIDGYYGGQSVGGTVTFQKCSLDPFALQQSYNLSGVTNVFLGDNTLTVRCVLSGKLEMEIKF